MSEQSLTVWKINDGKRGHENIANGFLDALAKRVSLEIFDIQPLGAGDTLRAMANRQVVSWHSLPTPVWVIGAGHGTHLSLLAAKRALRARALVLMRPTLPLAWFDACVAPEHDCLPPSPNHFHTRGVPNRIQPDPSRPRDGAPPPTRGLILIGGPSRHHSWLTAELIEQIDGLVQSDRTVAWTISDSRRTPDETREKLLRFRSERVHVVDHRQVGADWLLEQFGQHDVAWVSEDSVSMVYESLSAGLALGVLRVPRRRQSRVIAGICDVVQQTPALWFDEWREGASPSPMRPPLNEAERAARWFVERFLSPGAGAPRACAR